MIAAQHDNKKDKATAALLTLLIVGLILLFLFLFRIITPNPPFPTEGGNEGEELNFGIYNEGTGTVEGPAIGDATSVVVDKSSTAKTEESNTEDESFKTGEEVLEKKENNPKIKNDKTVITPIKTKEEIQKEEEDVAAKNLLNAYTKNKNKAQGGGDGNSEQAGNEGVPEGNPDTHGKGGIGNNPNEPGNGGHGGKDGIGYGLKGRKILVAPPKVTDSKEEGIVVVYITVDKQGNVIDADPTGKGTTTSSSVLKSKARQAALQAKFSPDDKFETQRGSIVFKFQF
ncbi:MAG TPA: energy transducer TonB [Bacteroidia bacterium]|nr:energy transducer TonB [Bacteroidia bacterium]